MKGSHASVEPPLATNFLSLFLALEPAIQEITSHALYLDELFAYIDHHWKLTRYDLETAPFNIEECLTLIQLQEMDAREPAELMRLKRIEFALLAILLEYLQNFIPVSRPLREFAKDVLSRRADVITFNYDLVAELAISLASGFGQETIHGSDPLDRPGVVTDELLGESHSAWKPALACGFRFDEVELPVCGPRPYVDGIRYYAHPGHDLYNDTRVLKLHGSIDWSWHTGSSQYVSEMPDPMVAGHPPAGICQGSAQWSWGRPPTRGMWDLAPVIIPPHLHKNYSQPPFAEVWSRARETLSRSQTLIVVGYSFPPSDFAIRRLFLEVFADHTLSALVVVNPDRSTVELVRHLTHFAGDIVVASDLSSFYGVPDDVL